MKATEQLIKDCNIIIQGGDITSSEGGFTQAPNFILVSKKVSFGAKLAYVMLLKYAWESDDCSSVLERLIDDIGVSKRSVVTFIKELESAGFIKLQRR